MKKVKEKYNKETGMFATNSDSDFTEDYKDWLEEMVEKQLILHDFSTRSFKKGDKVIACNKLEGTVVFSETRTMVKVKIKGTTIGINARSLQLKSI